LHSITFVSASDHDTAPPVEIYDVIGIVLGLIVGLLFYLIILKIINTLAEKEAKQKLA
jgi:hypothetical protein